MTCHFLDGDVPNALRIGQKYPDCYDSEIIVPAYKVHDSRVRSCDPGSLSIVLVFACVIGAVAYRFGQGGCQVCIVGFYRTISDSILIPQLVLQLAKYTGVL